MTTTDGIDSAGTANLAFLEELFAQYQHDPESLSADWRQYFDSLVKVSSDTLVNGHSSGEHLASTDNQLQKVSKVVGGNGIQPKGSSKQPIVQTEERNGLLEDDTMITPEVLRQAMLLRLPRGSCSCPTLPQVK